MLLCSRTPVVTSKGCQPITGDGPLTQAQPKQILVVKSEQREFISDWNRPLHFNCPKPSRFEPSKFRRPTCGTPVKESFDFSDEEDTPASTPREADDVDEDMSEDESNWFLSKHEKSRKDPMVEEDEELFELQ